MKGTDLGTTIRMKATTGGQCKKQHKGKTFKSWRVYTVKSWLNAKVSNDSFHVTSRWLS